MRILYLAHRIPYPPNKGDKIRAYHQVRHLATEHDVDVCTLFDDAADERHVADLERLGVRVHAHRLGYVGARARALWDLARGRTFSPGFFREPLLRETVAALLARDDYDVVVVFCSAMGDMLPRRFVESDTPLLADYCDLDSAKWAALAPGQAAPLRVAFSAEARRLAAYETTLAERCERVVFATPAEADDFVALHPEGQISEAARSVEVIPNGVDRTRFDRGDRQPSSRPSLVFTGAMDYRPNHEAMTWFLKLVWPRVRALVADAELRIVGSRPPRTLREVDGRDGVTVTGRVPDVRPHIWRAWLAVAPLQVARGVQNKVLEAMAAGVPTIISPAASRGLSAIRGVETIVAETPGEWAESIARLLSDEEQRRQVATRALRYVEREHDWEAHGSRWSELLEHLGARRRRRVA